MLRFKPMAGAALTAIAGVVLNSHPARAISAGAAVTDPTYGFVVKLDIGGARSCTGALVQPLWVVTAASCFKFGDQPLQAGAPPRPTSVIVGRTNLALSSGDVVPVMQLVPASDRNLVLARLARRVDGVTPIAIGTTPPGVGEHLRVLGFGRTSSEWVPQALQSGTFSVQSVAATTLSITGDAPQPDAGAPPQPRPNTCRGDSGGPTVRERSGALELVAITNTSWQTGCLAETDTRLGATQARVDNLAGWIQQPRGVHNQNGSIAWSNAVTCVCWHRDCWGGFCSGPGCGARPTCERSSTTYDVKSGDFDADGKADVLTLSPNALGGWGQNAAVEFSRAGQFESRLLPIATAIHMRNGGADRYYRTLEGDFDGNGTTDLATVSPDGGGGWADWIALELGKKGGGFDSQVWGAATPIHMRNGGARAYIIKTGDYNGDGKTDIATVSPDGGGGWADWIAVELATSSGRFDSQVWAASTPAHMRNGGANSYFVLPGDYNGDGRTDLATISPNGGGGWADWIALELAKPGGGFDSQSWPAATPIHMRNGGNTSTYHVLAADFTGDGRTDIATISPNAGGGWADWLSVEVAKSGGGFDSQVWSAPTPMHMRNGGPNANYRVIAADVNGDGKADVVTLSTTGGGGWAEWVAVEISTGTSFTHTVWSTPTPALIRSGDANQDYRLLAADLDGNDMTDFAVLSPTGSTSWWTSLSVDRSTGTGFTSGAWNASTPIWMRLGMR